MTKIVWLDAGHGGTDPGAVGNGLKEKDIALKLVKECGDYLLANYSGVDVRYSRTTDTFLELSTRTSKANSAKADVCVSIHCNSATSASANGFETFIYNGTVSSGTKQLQQAIHDSVWSFYKQNGISTDRGKKTANLHMVRETNMPSTLTENLFMPNSEILKFSNSEFLKGVAHAHAKGIASYLGLSKKSNSTSSSSNTSTSTPTSTSSSSATRAATYYSVPNYSGTSLVEALNKINVDSSLTNRTAIAKLNGISSYTGSAAQNTNLLNLLLKGKLIKSTASNSTTTSTNYYTTPNYTGTSLVEALNKINVDSSLTHRTAIAKANGISPYTGTATQNTKLLTLLLSGKLIKA